MNEAWCEVCGNLFSQRDFRQKSCSKKCQRKRHYRLHADQMRAKTRRRRMQNPEKFRENDRKRHALLREELNKRHKDRIRFRRAVYPWLPLLTNARYRAKTSRLECDLTSEWAMSRWTGKCEITGIEFRHLTHRCGPHVFSPSIDRIDSKQGYTKSNCRFVLWAINAMRQDGTDDDMYMIAEAMVSNRGVSHMD